MVRLIWAEAVQIYEAGEDLFLPPNIEKIAREVQESYEEENPRAGIIADYLDRLLPTDWESMDIYSRRAFLESDTKGTIERSTVCALEIWAEVLGGNPEKFDRYAIKEIRDILAQMPEWESQGRTQKTIKPYGRQRYFERKKTE